MKLQSLHKHWEKYAQQDPMWAILTSPGKENRAWSEDEFYQTGIAQVDELMLWVQHALPLLGKPARGLDFGSGMGRLTQALASRCGRVTGVDISQTMVDLATASKRRPANCDFVCNQEPNLRVFEDGSFDFVHSSITLQHIRPEFSRVYLAEFFRILKPGGTAVFQLPTRNTTDKSPMHKRYRDWWQRSLSTVNGWRGKPVMEMHGIPEEDVRAICLANDMAIVALRPSEAGGPDWHSFEYLTVKRLHLHTAMRSGGMKA
jgi:ubiquinone/menaquinone biosynthesis C-methylase UbiE